MKKYLFILLMSLFAQNGYCDGESCTITGAGDGSTIMVVNSWQEESKICVSAFNDSDSVNANIKVLVKVNYGGSRSKEFVGYGMAKPATSTKIEIPIATKEAGCMMTGYEIISISGNKCQ